MQGGNFMYPSGNFMYPRGKYRSYLGSIVLIGKLHFTSQMSEDVVAEICSVSKFK